jgi:hypothetical protein
MTMALYRSKFFLNFFYVLDFVVVGTSLVLEVSRVPAAPRRRPLSVR